MPKNVQLKADGVAAFPKTSSDMIVGLDAVFSSLSALKHHFIDHFYPIGSMLYLTTEDNPAAILGGTWEAIEAGVVVVGAGSFTDGNSEMREYAGNTFYNGNNQHVMTAGECPPHVHYNGWTSIGISGSNDSGYDDGRKGTLNSAYYTSYTGGSLPQNTQQPFVVLYIFQRTA